MVLEARYHGAVVRYVEWWLGEVWRPQPASSGDSGAENVEQFYDLLDSNGQDNLDEVE